MRDQGWITQSEYDEAMADNVYDRIQLVNVELQATNINSYFIDELTDQVINRSGCPEGIHRDPGL